MPNLAETFWQLPKPKLLSASQNFWLLVELYENVRLVCDIVPGLLLGELAERLGVLSVHDRLLEPHVRRVVRLGGLPLLLRVGLQRGVRRPTTTTPIFVTFGIHFVDLGTLGILRICLLLRHDSHQPLLLTHSHPDCVQYVPRAGIGTAWMIMIC